VALDLPEPVVRAATAWQETVLAGRSALRLTGRESLHVTLSFLGAQPPGAVAELSAACSALAGAPVTELALGEPVWLPRRRPRVLALRIEDDRAELRETQAWLVGELARTGRFAPEARLFFPHVTVSRVRPGERVRPSALPAPDPVEFRAETITLYRSHLGGGPARYEPVHRVGLAER
jgi:2'-5' RNA ligase